MKTALFSLPEPGGDQFLRRTVEDKNDPCKVFDGTNLFLKGEIVDGRGENWQLLRLIGRQNSDQFQNDFSEKEVQEE